ncbi:MAG TPA: hypothetical protein VF399_00680 [bacterium]
MEKLIGKITHYFGKIQVAVLELTDDELNAGDTIHIKGKTADFSQTVTSMQVDRNPVTSAKKGDAVGTKVDAPVHEHDQVFKVTAD